MGWWATRAPPRVAPTSPTHQLGLKAVLVPPVVHVFVSGPEVGKVVVQFMGERAEIVSELRPTMHLS